MKNSRRRRRLKSRAKTRPKSSCKRTSVNQQQLSFDQLEARHLLATLVVNSAADLPVDLSDGCLLYTSPSPRDQRGSRMPSSA